jgi:hypothetical protein
MQNGRIVTVERGEGNELNNYAGRNATIVKVCEPFAIIDIENVGPRGCLTEFLHHRRLILNRDSHNDP